MKFRKLAIVAAVVSASGLGMAGNAQAGSYAYSFNEIDNLTTVFICHTTNDIGIPISAPCTIATADSPSAGISDHFVCLADWFILPQGSSINAVWRNAIQTHPTGKKGKIMIRNVATIRATFLSEQKNQTLITIS